MLSRNPLTWLFRVGWIFVLGIVGAIATGNPLYLLLCALGFAVLVGLLVIDSVRPAPQWAKLMDTGMEQAKKGDWTDALASFKDAMARCKGGSFRLQASEQIGLFLLAANRPGDAEPYLREAVTLTTLAFGPTAVRTVTLRNHLSDLYMNAGQTWQAAQLQGSAMSGVSKLPSATTGAADTAARYAEALQLSGDSAQASVYNQKALEALEKADRKSPLFVRAVISASRAAIATGDQSRAIELLKQALDSANDRTSHYVIDDARETLVDLYAKAERYSEAILVMQERLKSRAGLEPGRNAEMRRRLADLLDAAGRSDEAMKERRVARTLDGMLTTAGHKAKPSADASAVEQLPSRQPSNGAETASADGAKETEQDEKR